MRLRALRDLRSSHGDRTVFNCCLTDLLIGGYISYFITKNNNQFNGPDGDGAWSILMTRHIAAWSVARGIRTGHFVRNLLESVAVRNLWFRNSIELLFQPAMLRAYGMIVNSRALIWCAVGYNALHCRTPLICLGVIRDLMVPSGAFPTLRSSVFIRFFLFC